jgi:hypothetical protein
MRNWLIRFAFMVCATMTPATINATSASLTISQDMPLRFGSIVVFGHGSRSVSANGETGNDQIYPVGINTSGPARFTVTYDRGSDPLREVSVTYLIMLGGVAPVNQSGLTGTLSRFDSDLPEASSILPGRGVVQTMPPCISQTCRSTFHIGAWLEVTQAKGGGTLSFSLPVSAKLVSVQGM